MSSIKSLMVTEMITAHPDEMVADVAQKMSRNKVGALLLIEDGQLRGLFSERDLLIRVIGEHRDPATTRVGFVATRDVTTIDANAQIKVVMRVFREKKFRHLPVLEGAKPVGILSTRDFLEYVVEGLERLIGDAKYKRELAEGADPYDHIGGGYGR